MERRTKNSVLRKGPHLSSWIWCMFIKVFCLPCIFSECLGDNITLSLYPPGDRRILYGDPLELYCIGEDGYGSENLEFLMGNKSLNFTVVNNTTIRYYEKLPKKQTTTFYCRNKITKKRCASRVVVDTTPPEVKIFTCLSKNLDELNCSWDGEFTEHVINYTLTFLVNGNPSLPCDVQTAQNLSCVHSWCKLSYLKTPLYRQQLDYYYFNLTSCNAFGCISQNFTIDHFSIVKPEPPMDLDVLQNESHSVTLQWRIHNNMVDLLKGGVDHRIQYQIAQVDNTSYFRSVDASHLPAKNKTYKYELSLPYAHWQYEVRIYIKPKRAKGEKYWSEYAYKMINTSGEKPQRPPRIAAGSFHQQVYTSHRLIRIYWSQLADIEEAGANFTYKVVLQGKKQETLFPENKSLSYISVNATKDALQVMVWSQNAEGTSDHYSPLYIPSESDTNSLRVRSFTKLVHANGTNELSWKKIKHDRVDNYTLFWCELNTTQTCTGRMNFSTLEADISKYSINLPTSTLYQFAISANKGIKSSGMTWAYCDIPREGMEWYQIPVALSHDAVDTTYVNLTWEVQCTFPDRFLLGYIIIYCPVVETTTSCFHDRNDTINIYNPEQKSVQVKNLLPYTTYQFTIALNTSSGVRQHNNSEPATTLEDAPTKPLSIRITNVTYNSVNISWEKPERANGKIITYKIITKSDGNLLPPIQVEDTYTHYHLTGLQSLSNYTITVKACNYNAKHHCSNVDPEDEIEVRTRIGPPGNISSSPVFNSSVGTINWLAPGRVDLYQVRILKDREEYDIQNTTELSLQTIRCEGNEMSYQVRAINFDADLYHGVRGDPRFVELPKKNGDVIDEYIGEWSQRYNMPCGQAGGLTLTLIILGVFLTVGVGYGSLKLYKKLKLMEDIKPVFPNGLSVPEKDLTKYGFGGWNQTNKDEKPSSDEMLLLPNSKSTVSPVSPGVKQNTADNCDSSDHTDSTALSNNSQGAIDRQSSISDNGSDSSLRLDIEQMRGDENATQEGDASVSESESSPEGSPYLNDQAFKKNPVSGYVQSVISPSNAMQAAPTPFQSPPHAVKSPTVPASTSYVMAGLSQPPIFTTGLTPGGVAPAPPSGYVRADDPQARLMNLPKLGPSPTKLFGPESLPTMPTLPSPKKGEDSSYIQLQCLESLPNLKLGARSPEAAPKPAASGYVSPGDPVLNKHLSNMMAARAPAPDAPILDPDMSPDAYCRFSWSKDPSIDNFNTILVDSSTLNSPKN